MAHAISLNEYAVAAQPNTLIARLVKAVADLSKYVSIRDELDAMSNRDLADIGLTRDDVRTVARDAVYGS